MCLLCQRETLSLLRWTVSLPTVCPWVRHYIFKAISKADLCSGGKPSLSQKIYFETKNSLCLCLQDVQKCDKPMKNCPQHIFKQILFQKCKDGLMFENINRTKSSIIKFSIQSLLLKRKHLEIKTSLLSKSNLNLYIKNY